MKSESEVGQPPSRSLQSRLEVAGRPALKYYFKNASGRQLEMLFLLDGQMQQTHYTLQYWSQGDGGQKAMTGARRLDTLVLP